MFLNDRYIYNIPVSLSARPPTYSLISVCLDGCSTFHVKKKSASLNQPFFSFGYIWGVSAVVRLSGKLHRYCWLYIEGCLSKWTCLSVWNAICLYVSRVVCLFVWTAVCLTLIVCLKGCQSDIYLYVDPLTFNINTRCRSLFSTPTTTMVPRCYPPLIFQNSMPVCPRQQLVLPFWNTRDLAYILVTDKHTKSDSCVATFCTDDIPRIACLTAVIFDLCIWAKFAYGGEKPAQGIFNMAEIVAADRNAFKVH